MFDRAALDGVEGNFREQLLPHRVEPRATTVSVLFFTGKADLARRRIASGWNSTVTPLGLDSAW